MDDERFGVFAPLPAGGVMPDPAVSSEMAVELP
jgi:hypothetical protein